MPSSPEAPLSSARAVLTQHGLPPRLLPDNVVAGSWDPATAVLTVTLAAKVRAAFGGIPVRYAKQIRAVVRAGHIPELEGVEARFALWLTVTAIHGEGETLAFSVGRIRKRLPLAAFR